MDRWCKCDTHTIFHWSCFKMRLWERGCLNSSLLVSLPALEGGGTKMWGEERSQGCANEEMRRGVWVCERGHMISSINQHWLIRHPSSTSPELFLLTSPSSLRSSRRRFSKYLLTLSCRPSFRHKFTSLHYNCMKIKYQSMSFSVLQLFCVQIEWPLKRALAKVANLNVRPRVNVDSAKRNKGNLK